MKVNMTHAVAAGALAASLMAAPATRAASKPATEDAAQSCFLADNVNGWTRVDDKTVRVSVGAGRQFDLELMAPPPSSLFQEAIILKAEPSGSVCTGNGLGVSVVTGGIAAAPSYQVVKVTQAPSVKEEREMRRKAKEAAAQAATGH
jgi:hypothetical protein